MRYTLFIQYYGCDDETDLKIIKTIGRDEDSWYYYGREGTRIGFLFGQLPALRRAIKRIEKLRTHDDTISWEFQDENGYKISSTKILIMH